MVKQSETSDGFPLLNIVYSSNHFINATCIDLRLVCVFGMLDWLIFYFFSIWMPIFVFVIHMVLEKSLSAVSLVICGCI